MRVKRNGLSTVNRSRVLSCSGNRVVWVSLIPYYRIAHERYNLYWKVVRRKGVKERAAGR